MKKLLFFSLLLSASITSYAQLNGNGFYRIRNASATNEYMKIAYDSINAQSIIGSLSNLQSDAGRTKAMNNVQPFLQTDIKMVNANNLFTDPGTVFYLETQAGSSNKYDLISQGVGLKYISTCVFVGSNAHAWGLSGMPAVINEVGTDSEGNKLYTAYVNLKLSYSLFIISYSIDETRFIGDEASKVVMTSVNNSNSYTSAPTTCRWYIEPLNLTDNYFAAAPIESLTQNSKYYTSLRTAFSYKVPSNSSVNVYKVTALPSVEGELATVEKINSSSANTVPSGLPVIIESSSLNNATNILEPCTPISKSVASFTPTTLMMGTVSNASISVTDVTNSDVLYNGYGHHGHDVYTSEWHNTNSSVNYGKKLWPGWGPDGDNVGFFSNIRGSYSPETNWTNSTEIIYKLGIKDGAVGFWNPVAANEKISGNEAYSPVQCQLFPVEKKLADIAEDGKENISYDVTDQYLYGVRVIGGKLYAKDYGKFRNPNTIGGGAIDGMGKFYDYSEAYDQSNWVALEVANASSYVGKDLHVIGKLINRENPEIKVAKIETSTAPISSYGLNVYSPASFTGTQTSETNGKTYFFVQPKPQEVAHISWAVYGGNGKFYVSKPEGNINDAHIKGGFIAKPDLLPSGSSMNDFVVGNIYEFDAVIKKAATSNVSLQAAYTEGGFSSAYEVYPLSSGNIVTGVTTVQAAGNVVSVKYYNAMGVESSVPFNGVNIVVTTYDNGTRTTSKVIR